MVLDASWMKRRWYEFRSGHSMYLSFALTFVNFLLIVYRLLIEQVPFLNVVFPTLWMFAVVLFIIYFPVAVVIGHWHRTLQLPTESNIGFMASPLFAKLYRIQIHIMQGTANKEEVEEMVNLLKKVEMSGK